MPALDTEFHCSNGHTFRANAKLRARCPECGVGTKRGFDKVVAAVVDKPEEPKVEPKVEPKKVIAGPVLIRQGRPRMPAKKAAAHAAPPKKLPAKRTILGSKASGGLVSRHRVTKVGIRPRVTGKPPKTAAARGIAAGNREVTTLYWHGVASKYGF